MLRKAAYYRSVSFAVGSVCYLDEDNLIGTNNIPWCNATPTSAACCWRIFGAAGKNFRAATGQKL
jgi:hypothetical protein